MRSRVIPERQARPQRQLESRLATVLGQAASGQTSCSRVYLIKFLDVSYVASTGSQALYPSLRSDTVVSAAAPIGNEYVGNDIVIVAQDTGGKWWILERCGHCPLPKNSPSPSSHSPGNPTCDRCGVGTPTARVMPAALTIAIDWPFCDELIVYELEQFGCIYEGGITVEDDEEGFEHYLGTYWAGSAFVPDPENPIYLTCEWHMSSPPVITGFNDAGCALATLTICSCDPLVARYDGIATLVADPLGNTILQCGRILTQQGIGCDPILEPGDYPYTIWILE